MAKPTPTVSHTAPPEVKPAFSPSPDLGRHTAITLYKAGKGGGWVFERLTIEGDKVVNREVRLGTKSDAWDRFKFCAVTDFLTGYPDRLR